MAVEVNRVGLSQQDQGHLRYFEQLAGQDLASWEGFYLTPSEGMNFGLRFQLAFMGYAAYALARQTPAYPGRYARLLQRLTERMIAPPTWAYWFQGAARRLPPEGAPEPETARGAGKLLEMAHSRLNIGQSVPPDPCQSGNIQYSAHLASLLGFYELLSGDQRYDDPGFDLRATSDEREFVFHYTHSGLAGHIHDQMQENHFGGVCCEPGRAYAACNNHACISNILHDRLHGTHLAEANGRWAEWVRTRMLTGGVKGGLPLPAPNGLLSVAYLTDLHLPMPVSFNLTDAWGLAFMAAWQPELVRQVYPRLQRRLKTERDGTLYMSSVGPNEKVEISSTGLNTAFAAVLAREMGDAPTFERLLAWADNHLQPEESAEGGRYYAAARPAPYVTALFALALALPATGGGLYTLVNEWQPDRAAPYLAEVEPGVTVCQAAFNSAEELELGLIAPAGHVAQLQIENCPTPIQIHLDGATLQTSTHDPAQRHQILQVQF